MSAFRKIRVLLRWVVRWLARIVATVLILLALLVGVARLLLPEASSFKEDIRVGVKEATGLQVDFDLISAGLSVYGPELRFSRTAIQWPDGSELATVDDIAVSLDVFAWVAGDGILPGRVYIKGTAVEVRYDENGLWTIQGRELQDFLPSESRGTMDDWPESRLELADVSFNFKNLQRNGPRIEGVINNFSAELDDDRIALSADLDPGLSYGRALSVQADIPLPLLAADTRMQSDEPWSVAAIADDFRLEKWIDIAEIQNLPVVDSAGDIQVQVEFRGVRPVGMSALLELEQLQLAHLGGEPVLIDWLDGEFTWRTSADGWLLEADNLRMERAAREWPSTEFSVGYAVGPEAEQQRITATAGFLRVEDLLPFIQAVVPGQLVERGLDGQVAGDFSDFGLTLSLFDNKLETFAIDAVFENAGYLSADKQFDVTGFSGRLSANEGGGNLEIATSDARLGLANVFRNVLPVSSLKGLAIWRAGPQGHRVLADGISLQTPDGAAEASLELTFDSDFGNPVIDLNATASLNDAKRAPYYLPNVIPDKVQSWLTDSLQGGSVPQADIQLSGPLKEFPYDQGEGIFLIGVNFVDGTLRYAPGWPAFLDASGVLVFDGVSMYTTENRLTLANTELQNITARMDDMRTGELLMAGKSQLQLVDLKGFLQESPIGQVLGPVFDDVEVAGTGRGDVELLLPIRNIGAWSLDGRLDITNAEIGLAGIAPRLTAVTGSARVSNARITADGLTGRLLEHDVTMRVEPIDSPTSAFSHRAFLNGELPVDDIQQMLGLPVTALLDGSIGVRGQALFPGGKGDPAPFRLAVRSDLRGMRSEFPAPLDKAADTPEGVQIELEFPRAGVTHVYGTLERGLSWAIEAVNEAGWGLTRGVILRGIDLPDLPVEAGLAISGDFDAFSLDDWIGLFANNDVVPSAGLLSDLTVSPSKAPWQSLFREVDVQIGELAALGHRFVDVDAEVLFRDADWDINIAGPWSEGHIQVPYDFAGAQPVTLELERLLLLEPLTGEGDDSDIQLDPRILPAVRGFVNDFSLGSLRLGRLDADIRRVADGLRAKQLQTRSESFDTTISYDWLVVDNAQRSRLHMELSSSNVEQTLQKLGYSPLIEADKGSVTADLLWEGGPGMDSIYASTGTVALSIEDGTVTEVSPGSGRILGLLSITTLPRRLSLDFKDMTDDGLAFDKIKGSFRIDFGDAWTCDLGLEGSVADMGVVGRTGILAQDYEQIAAIRPHVSNLAPVAGAFLAGPTIGVATLLITQILKKPLSSIGESYYSISGPWDDAQFIKSEQSDLDTAAFAACESQLPPLSPEEIKAIEELIANPGAIDAGAVDQSSGLPPTAEQ